MMAELCEPTMSNPSSQRLRRRLLFWGLYFAFWTLIGLTFADYIHRNWLNRGSDASWSKALLSALPDVYIWAMLSPLIFWLTRRIPVQGRSWRRGLLVYFPASMVLYALAILLIISFDLFFVWPPLKSSFWTVYRFYLRQEFWSGMLAAWGVIALSHAVEYARRHRQGELAASRLAVQLARAQLQVLRMQLQPHFLFNTLHAISTLMRRDVDAAERMLIRLADLLRMTLEHGDRQEVTLRRELEFLEHYLHIERVRFGSRLEIAIDIPVELENALVPNLLLQPLVENAIKHGISPNTESGLIEIVARRIGNDLRLEILDNGSGLPESYRMRKREGVGLANTRKRLEQVYPESHGFEIANRENGGLRVGIRIPFRLEDELSEEAHA